MAYLYILRPSFFVGMVAQFCSVWTCVAITLDRFLAIRFPLHSRSWCTEGRATKIIFFVIFLGVLFRLPSLFELNFNCSFNKKENRTFCQLYQSEMRKNADYQTVYKTYAYTLVVFLIPFSVMIVLNAVLVRTLNKAQAERAKVLQRRSSSASNGRDRWDNERRCTITAVLVILTFVVSNLLSIVNNIMETQRQSKTEDLPMKASIYLGNFLVCLNSASNFIIYCVIGQRFRQMFVHIFCRCCLASVSSVGNSKRSSMNGSRLLERGRRETLEDNAAPLLSTAVEDVQLTDLRVSFRLPSSGSA